MKYLLFAAIALFLNSCTQSDPHPESRDEIYHDLETELEIANKSFDTEEKLHDRLEIDIGKALPQTGQIKYATKKLRDSAARINTLAQQKLYFGIKLEQRKAYVQSRYEESLKDKGRRWPDEEELSLYRSVVKFNREKITWDKNKGMKKVVPHGTTEEKAEHAPAEH